MPPRLLQSVAACVCLVMLATLAPTRARADDHLPILDIQPVTTWAAAGKALGTPATPLVSGNINIAGTATIPIFKGFSASYDRIVNGLFNQTFDQVIIPGVGPVQAGSYNDVVQQFRIDERIKGFTLEAGSASRHRICCPGSGDTHNPASTEWHQLYLGLTYATHPITQLANSILVLNVTGHGAHHKPSPADLASETPGTTDIGKNEYGTTQAATLVIPVDAKHGFTTSGTYTWGSFDYFEDFPYPLNYGIWVFTANKSFNKTFGIELREANLWQRPNQNTPFPGNAIHLVDWSLVANFHFNLNHLGK